MEKPTIKINKSTEKNFSIVFFIFFLILSIYFVQYSYIISILLLSLSLVLIFLGFNKPELLTTLNHYWYKFGILLGKLISPIIMFLIYFIVLFPTSIILKIIGKDPLEKKFERNKKSYWISRKVPIQPFSDQF